MSDFQHIYEMSESIFISELYHTKHYKSMNDGINQNKPHMTRSWQEVMPWEVSVPQCLAFVNVKFDLGKDGQRAHVGKVECCSWQVAHTPADPQTIYAHHTNTG